MPVEIGAKDSNIAERFVNYCIDELLARMETKFIPEPNSGCWLWDGSTNSHGYGMINLMGRPMLAHRVAYEFLKGPIQRGLVVDHKCRTRCCINPDHLEPVTMAENTRRGHGPTLTVIRRAKQTQCKNGHPLTSESWGRVCKICRLVSKRRFNAKIPKRGRNLSGLKLGPEISAKIRKARTHCQRGHEFNEANTHVDKNGWRYCKACDAMRARASKIGVPC